jgi:hypothetical protein
MKEKAFREFREVKIRYVNEYRKQTLHHKMRIDYLGKARDMILKHLFGAEELRKPKRKSQLACLSRDNSLNDIVSDEHASSKSPL